MPACGHCNRAGVARYRHQFEDRWIDVCTFCKPAGTDALRYYHTHRHLGYPASTPAEVSNPGAFIRS